MSNLTNLIKDIFIFKNLSEKDIAEIADLGKIVNFQKGQAIFKQEEKNKNVYIIVKGKAKIILTKDNMQDIIIEIIKEKNILGSINFFSNEPTYLNVIAITEMTLFLICENNFNTILEKYPAISINLLKEWARRINLANSRVQNNNLCSLKKIVKVILEFAENQEKSESGEILLPGLKHHEWASYTDLSRETFTRCLSKLKKENIITTRSDYSKQLIIKDIDKLRAFLK